MPSARSCQSADGTMQCLSSDSGEEDPSETPSIRPSAPAPARSDFMKRAVAFLRRSGHSSSVQSSDSPSCPVANGHAPMVTSHAHSAYVSSDNDSEFEDADMKRELQKLREKWVKLRVLTLAQSKSENVLTQVLVLVHNSSVHIIKLGNLSPQCNNYFTSETTFLFWPTTSYIII